MGPHPAKESDPVTSHVYRQKPLAPDELLGRIDLDGKVYETRLGPDKYVGRVNIDTGKIYVAIPGPDKYLGRVDLGSGKVFLHKVLALDTYLGRVDDDGRFLRHKVLARDDYIGRMTEMASYAHGGAAFLLLVWPEIEKEAESKGKG
jgi:hypothetical protein